MFVCCECCVLSVRGICDELIIRPGESYRLWCVVYDLETTKFLVNEEEAKTHRGLSRQEKKIEKNEGNYSIPKFSAGLVKRFPHIL